LTRAAQQDAVFAAIQQENHAVLGLEVPAVFLHAKTIVALANQAKLPTMFAGDWAAFGPMLAYGTSIAEGGRRMAGMVDRILMGTKAGDLPIEVVTKRQFTINQIGYTCIAEDRHSGKTGYDLLQQAHLVSGLAYVEICDAGSIAAGPMHTGNEPVDNRVQYDRKDDRNARRDLADGSDRHSTNDHNHLDPRRDHLGGEVGQELISACRKPRLYLKILSLNITQPGELIAEIGKNRAVAASRQDNPNTPRRLRDLLA
jgi:ABC transporter substrate binding protein